MNDTVGAICWLTIFEAIRGKPIGSNEPLTSDLEPTFGTSSNSNSLANLTSAAFSGWMHSCEKEQYYCNKFPGPIADKEKSIRTSESNLCVFAVDIG